MCKSTNSESDSNLHLMLKTRNEIKTIPNKPLNSITKYINNNAPLLVKNIIHSWILNLLIPFYVHTQFIADLKLNK